MTGAEFGGVDIDLLADYIGGALTGTPEESAVAARVADDPDWHAAYASLAEGMAVVSAELGRFQPEPMPSDLVARLDAALTMPPAELGSDSRPTFLDLIAAGADPQPIADTAGADHQPIAGTAGTNTARAPGETTGTDTTREVPETAAAGADLSPRTMAHLTLVGDGDTEGDGANLVRETAPAPRPGRRLRWAAPIAVAAGVIAFVGFGLDYLHGLSTHSNSATSASSGESADKRADAPLIARSPIRAGQLLASGTNYTRATLGTPPVEPLTAPFASSGGSPGDSSPVHKTSPGAVADRGSALKRLIAGAALDDCLSAIEQENAGGNLSVESVDFARFAGAPAVIVRFTADNGHWAWASGADCGTPPGDAATLDKVPVG